MDILRLGWAFVQFQPETMRFWLESESLSLGVTKLAHVPRRKSHPLISPRPKLRLRISGEDQSNRCFNQRRQRLHAENFFSGIYRTMVSPQDYTGENPLWQSDEPYLASVVSGTFQVLDTIPDNPRSRHNFSPDQIHDRRICWVLSASVSQQNIRFPGSSEV